MRFRPIEAALGGLISLLLLASLLAAVEVAGPRQGCTCRPHQQLHHYFGAATRLR